MSPGRKSRVAITAWLMMNIALALGTTGCGSGSGPSNPPAAGNAPAAPRNDVDTKFDEFERHLEAIDLLFRDVDAVPPAQAAEKSVAANAHITAMGAIVNSLKTTATTPEQDARFRPLMARADAHMRKNLELSARLRGP